MNRLISKLKNSKNKNVLVVGDLMLDEYVFGDVDRISPEAPVPVLKEEYREWCCGGAGNVAISCKRVGFNVDVVGIVGAGDMKGEKLLSMFSENELNVEGILESVERPTITKNRLMAKHQQLLRIDTENKKPLQETERAALLGRINVLMKPDSVVVISDYAKGVVDQDIVAHVVRVAKERNCTVIADPKGPHFDKYYGVNYVKPNLKEFNEMVSFFNLPDDNTMIQNGKIICDMLSLQGLIVTMGEKGIQFISHELCIVSPAIKQDVFDVTGAGDTVLSFLAFGLVNNLSWHDCLKVANKAAAVAVSHVKTYPVHLDELLDAPQDANAKIVSNWERLNLKLKVLRQNCDKKIVFTNGCFDLLHSGHLYILNEAKKHGDILVVAINTDDSVKRFKGDARPIKKLEERIMLMSALEMVDFVTIFDQDTPRELISFLQPDVLVKGGDYQKEEIAGADVVQANGGEVVIIDYKNGYSTTNLIKAMERGGQEGSL
jgi:D-beta-D-heptose 7-phosphate kinase / D-beta-D-heptose 1-phosphate adenosyltransferase